MTHLVFRPPWTFRRRFIMGCYGIGINRIMAAAIEAHHDAAGIRFPMSIAPFQVLIAALDVRSSLSLGQESAPR